MADEIKKASLGIGTGLSSAGTALAGQTAGNILGLIFQNASNRNNYKWGEKAAESDFSRQMELYERQYKDKSPLNVVNQLKEAGLSKGLMFSGGASGVGGAASGTTAGTNKMGMSQMQGMNLAVTMAQLDNIKADSELKRAQASKASEETTTITGSRDAIINKLITEGHGQWLSNFQEQYKMNTPKDGENINYNDPNKGFYGNDKIKGDSLFTQEITSNITKTLADAGNSAAQELLTNKKAEGYFTELLNDTVRADSSKIQATAQKLASEWNTGEFTNWKTWADLASKAISTIK